MIDWDVIAPMIALVVLFLTIGGVLVLRPISKRVGDLLEIMAREKQQGLENDVAQIRDLMETVNARMQLLEERQDFTERLIAGEQRRKELPPPG